MMLRKFAGAAAIAGAGVMQLSAALPSPFISIPNGSFESPVVDPNVAPAYPAISNWQDMPKPDFWDESQFGSWDNLTGVFPNPAAQPGRINNLDGKQAAYLFATAGAGFYQDLANAAFEPGVSYSLNVALVGSTAQPPVTGTTLEISLYYRNGANEMVTIGSKTVTYNFPTFPSDTQTFDFAVNLPAVQGANAWAGKPIGIKIVSTAAQDRSGGVWDVENVRIDATRESFDLANASFEAPAVDPNVAPAYPFIVGWQDNPKPDFWDESEFGPWDNLTGVFPNPAAGQPGRVENFDQAQAAYLFATAPAGFFQDTAAKFEPGVSYSATVALVGSSSQRPVEGTTLAISLYYRNAGNEIVNVATTTATYNAATFPNFLRTVDFTARTSAVLGTDAWAGKPIGIKIQSTAAQDKSGGVWDVENVRLSAVREFLEVANHSFEAPAVDPQVAPAYPTIVAWADNPKPAFWDESQFGSWDNLTGVFPNPATGQPGRIDNMDLNQAAYLFSGSDAGISQSLNAKFEPGSTYIVKVGAVGSASLPPNANNSLTIQLFYWNGDARVPVASKTVAYNAQNFPTLTSFVDVRAAARGTAANFDFANKQIGVYIVSPFTQDNPGGVWDIDNVRVLVRQGVALRVSLEGSNLRVAWDTAPGETYQLTGGNSFASPFSDVGPSVIGTGFEASQTVPINEDMQFFTVRALGL